MAPTPASATILPFPILGMRQADRPAAEGGRRREEAPWRQEGQRPVGAGSGPSGRRLLSLALPRLPIERYLRQKGCPEDALLALARPGPHGAVIWAATRAAEANGALPGLRVVDVRVACPALRVEEADPAGDTRALLSLMLWARRWCPWTAVEDGGGSGLAMDLTGSAHLWGGEVALLAEIRERLAGMGLTCRLAVAPTHGAAWALARFAGPQAICGPGEIEAMTGPLPVRALRLSPDTALLLRRLGLPTVGALMTVPRLPLARRFARAEPGGNPLLRLDQLTGRLPEPISWPEEPPRFAARAALSEPMLDPAPLLPLLARDLCAMLGAKGFGARGVRLLLYRTDGRVAEAEAATARPTRDAAHLARLIEGRLDGIDPGFGFDHVMLVASVAEPLPTRQPGLDGREDGGEDLARLMDRLSTRFGPRALRRPLLRESHVPERREAWVPVPGPEAPAGSPPAPPGTPPRPLRLFDPPEEVRVTYALPEGPPAQFVWRRVTHRVTRFAGPERIAPEWWRAPPGARARDYWRIEDQEGRRFWLYREGLPDDGRGGTPRWFMQGIFG